MERLGQQVQQLLSQIGGSWPIFTAGFVVGIVLMLLIWLMAVRRRRTEAPGEFGGLLLLLIVTAFFWAQTREPALLYLLIGVAGGFLALTGARAGRAMLTSPAEAEVEAAPAAAAAGRPAAGAPARAPAPAAGVAPTARPTGR
jgi:hypothetical protein